MSIFGGAAGQTTLGARTSAFSQTGGNFRPTNVTGGVTSGTGLGYGGGSSSVLDDGAWTLPPPLPIVDTSMSGGSPNQPPSTSQCSFCDEVSNFAGQYWMFLLIGGAFVVALILLAMSG